MINYATHAHSTFVIRNAKPFPFINMKFVMIYLVIQNKAAHISSLLNQLGLLEYLCRGVILHYF